MPKVNINENHNTYRLRWSYKGIRYSLNIGLINKASLKAAKAKAKLIESDILFDRFDTSLTKYGKSELVTHNIFSAWEEYKLTNAKRIALTSQQNGWKNVDKCLSKVSRSLLEIDKSDELVNELLKHYSPGTLKRVLTDLNAASKNYYDLKKLPKIAKQPIKCFSNEEIKVIIKSFQDDTFKAASSLYSHSYYTNYVSFLAYTGCRPEEAISLTWDDIDLRSSLIRFDKAYSKGVLKDTKNHKVRNFPINSQLKALLTPIDKDNVLVFPSVNGGYINQRMWHRRYWNQVLNCLVEKKLVKERLRSYCLRHSFITRCIRSGLDISTIASISGNSTETIMRYYLAAQNVETLELPEI